MVAVRPFADHAIEDRLDQGFLGRKIFVQQRLAHADPVGEIARRRGEAVPGEKFGGLLENDLLARFRRHALGAPAHWL